MSKTINIDDLLVTWVELKRRADIFAESKKTGSWWCVSGYADVIARAIVDIKRHEKRAIKCYGDKAMKFEDSLATAPTPNFEGTT